MTTIAAVQVGNYLGRGAEYVRKLFNGCRRSVPDARYVVLTDDPACAPEYAQAVKVPPGLDGWWNKLLLFAPDVFPAGERVLYFDLDTIIRGNIAELAAYDGPFAIMRDTYNPHGRQSAVMAWEAGTVDHVWAMWLEAGRPMIVGGDQTWISFVCPEAVVLDDQFPGRFVSFKKHCMRQGAIPDGTSVVMFHGEPRPHNAALVLPWIDELWSR